MRNDIPYEIVSKNPIIWLGSKESANYIVTGAQISLSFVLYNFLSTNRRTTLRSHLVSVKEKLSWFLLV